MKITKTEIETIAKTLPIGLYAKRRIPLTISETDPTSWYNPSTDELYISLEQIEKAFSTVKENSLSETKKGELIRSNLYHEVSHAILTPTHLRISNPMNIFEDERIETILSDFYLDVNFEQSKLLMNGFNSINDVPAPTNAMEYFYSICRFHKGEEDLVKKFYEIFDSAKVLTKTKETWNDGNCNYYDSYDYEIEVRHFYEEVEKRFNENFSNIQNMFNQNTCYNGNYSDLKGSEEKDPNANTNTENAQGEPINEVESDEQGEINKFHTMGVDAFHEVLNHFVDSKTTNALEMIIADFNKKCGGGSSVKGYSGVINPRNVGREDYRIFERKSSVKGENAYGSVHLNLFIDVSGSFQPNEEEVNKILTSLSTLERKYSYFTFDVIYCSYGMRVAPKEKKMITCCGGNRLHREETLKVYRSLQKKNTLNYNIILFDGDCGDSRGKNNALSVFDNANCTLITEYSNKQYCGNFKNTKPIIENTHYTEKLLDNIVKAMKKGFR